MVLKGLVFASVFIISYTNLKHGNGGLGTIGIDDKFSSRLQLLTVYLTNYVSTLSVFGSMEE